MRVIRTGTWMILTAILVAFSIINWGSAAQVNFWIGSDGKGIGFGWPVTIIAIFFFLLGLIPTWLMSKAKGWRYKRQISALQNYTQVNPSPSLSTTQLAEAEPANPAN